jgi:capsular exopolysaccharide synthesis family protein
LDGAEQSRLLVLTSATPDEGKSISASNLAVTLAQQQIPTLLVDADLRRGSLHERFATAREPGLSEVLRGDSTLNDAMHELRLEEYGIPLYFLAAGSFPPNPAELLGSDRMRRFCEEVRKRYRAIIFDAPPLNLFTDAATLGREADATLLITRAGVTEKEALEHAVAQLQRLGASGGVVLNDVHSNGGYERYYSRTAAAAGRGAPLVPSEDDGVVIP